MNKKKYFKELKTLIFHPRRDMVKTKNSEEWIPFQEWKKQRRGRIRKK